MGSREIPQKNLGSIGSAVLTFIGYKEKTDKPNLYILGFKGASHPSSISTFNRDFISEHVLFESIKQKQKIVCGFNNIFFNSFSF